MVNLRGELDLTADKHSIVNTNTGYLLIRGRNINYYNLLTASQNEFIADEFVNTNP